MWWGDALKVEANFLVDFEYGHVGITRFNFFRAGQTMSIRPCQGSTAKTINTNKRYIQKERSHRSNSRIFCKTHLYKSGTSNINEKMAATDSPFCVFYCQSLSILHITITIFSSLEDGPPRICWRKLIRRLLILLSVLA